MTGRTPPPLEELMLSSGITVKIRKVSPMTLQAVKRQYPRPAPPLVENDYGDGKVRREPNPADPAYAQALEDHLQMVGLKVIDVLMDLGVDVAPDAEAVAAFRARMQRHGIEVQGDDHQIYVQHIAIQTEDDLERVREAITRKAMPTEEAVQEHLATFPGDVQGARPDGDPAAALGSQL